MKFWDLLQNSEYKNDKTLSPCGRADTTVLLYKDPGLYNQHAFIQQISAECLPSVRQWMLSGPWKKCTSGLLESCPPVRCLMSSTPMVPCLPLLVMQFCWVAVGFSLTPRDALCLARVDSWLQITWLLLSSWGIDFTVSHSVFTVGPTRVLISIL